MTWMWIVAGPNGAGKSTFTAELLRSLALPDLIKLNADEVTASYRAADADAPQDELNLRAARFIDDEVARCIFRRRDFLVETVLSSAKYRDDVETAKAARFKVGLVYISLHPPSLSPDRVSERVAKGGHAVERETAIARYHRSHEQLVWFARQADALYVFDNSRADGAPVLLVRRTHQSWFFKAGYNPAVDMAMRAAFPESD